MRASSTSKMILQRENIFFGAKAFFAVVFAACFLVQVRDQVRDLN